VLDSRPCLSFNFSFLFLFVFLAPVLVSAQPRQKSTNERVDEVSRLLGSVQNYRQVAISPDGLHIAMVQSKPGDGGEGTSILITEVNAHEPSHRITAASTGFVYEDEVEWSPDSKQIAFLSDAAKSGQQQLYVADLATGKARKLTDLRGYLTSPLWSPDGKSLALLFTENLPRSAGPLQPMTPPSGVIEEHVYEQRINVVDVESGKIRAVSPPDMYVYEYDWMPDGSGFAGSAAHGNGDNNWWIAQLYWFGLDGQNRLIYQPKLQIANPQVSPDGKSVAFIEGLMSDQGVTGGDVYVAPVSGGNAANLTPGMRASATWLAWTAPQQVMFTEFVEGNSAVSVVDTAGKINIVWTGPEMISASGYDMSLSLAHDGRASAVVRSSGVHPPEIWAGEVGGWKQITTANKNVKPLWGAPRSVQWKSDQWNVQGWLLPPLNYEADKKYPLLVHVHGGPASACSAGWSAEAAMAAFAASGYFVLCPNPRGSYGQGEAFTAANVKDFGGGDFRDIMAGVDEVIREFPIDPNRLGIGGWSYGGYMTMWAETQTHRFGAAIAGAGLSDWLSYYGENDIDQWMIPYFGASVYDDPAVYAKAAPIEFVKNVKTPTLILVGDRDGECPAPQSFEWWHALRTLHVPVEFVVYAGEGHQIQQPEHRKDLLVRSLQWYDKWLGGNSQ
jgi:dipeptidyl aminopeptidase/acylaminoacyl peptidase